MLKFSKEALLSLGGKDRQKAQDFASLYKRQKEAHQRRRVIIKTEEQIEGIRKSSALTAEILDMLEERVKPGVTTEQIDRWVYGYTVEHGATPAPLNYRGFPKSVCTSINEVVCHGIRRRGS